MNVLLYISDTSHNNHYEIRFTTDRSHPDFFLSNAGGELMSLSEQQFFDIIDKFFKENF